MYFQAAGEGGKAVRGVWAGQKSQREGESVDIRAAVQLQLCCANFEGLTAPWHREGSEEFKGMSTAFLNSENRKRDWANENKKKEDKRERLWKLV